MVQPVRFPLVTNAVTVLMAHLDETASVLPDGRLIHGVAAVLTSPADRQALVDGLSKLLLPQRAHLHHYDEIAGWLDTV